MKVMLEIEDKKAPALMEVLNGLKYVKATPVKAKLKSKEKFLKELQESVEEVKLHKAGKVKMKSAKELLDEL